MAAKEPAAIRALRASLRGAGESELRERLQVAIRGLQRLYNRPAEPEPQDDGDLRRQRFTADRHPAPSRKHTSTLAPTDDDELL